MFLLLSHINARIDPEHPNEWIPVSPPFSAFVAIDRSDGANEKVYVMLRDSLEILTSFGDGGRQPGQFYAVHSIATDSKGNIYTTETYRGQRVQRFLYKGLGSVAKADQGTIWPRK